MCQILATLQLCAVTNRGIHQKTVQDKLIYDTIAIAIYVANSVVMVIA